MIKRSTWIQLFLESIRLDLSTRLVIQLGNGIPLVYANAMELHRHTDDGDTYRMASRNAWIKAVFLCGKFRELPPLRVLSEFKIGFFDELIAFW